MAQPKVEEQEHDDPGMLFILKPSADVHACMGLSSMGNLSPPLQQGGRICDYHFY